MSNYRNMLLWIAGVAGAFYLFRNRHLLGQNNQRTQSAVSVQPNTTFLERTIGGLPPRIYNTQVSGQSTAQDSSESFSSYANIGRVLRG